MAVAGAWLCCGVVTSSAAKCDVAVCVTTQAAACDDALMLICSCFTGSAACSAVVEVAVGGVCEGVVDVCVVCECSV